VKKLYTPRQAAEILSKEVKGSVVAVSDKVDEIAVLAVKGKIVILVPGRRLISREELEEVLEKTV